MKLGLSGSNIVWREILYDKDGGSIHIDWYNDQDNIPSAIIVIVPGVGGCSQVVHCPFLSLTYHLDHLCA